MKTIKGPGIFLAQFIGAEPPFNTFDGLAEWAAGLGFKALQLPCNHPAIFDLQQAATSQTYCDDIAGRLAERGLVISELSTHLEGQLVAVNSAYDSAFDAFAPAALRGNPGRWRGLTSTRGRRITRCCWTRRLTNWLAAGGQSWTALTSMVSICATKFTPVKTCTTV